MSLLPITILVFLLSKRFGMLADQIGPHIFMSAGPILAGLGLLLLVRVDASADYVTQVLPGILVFGLGIAATVAPLTATVLGSVEPGHSGLASGVNNAVARVASLLAIAALGAVIAGAFQSRVDREINAGHLSGPARVALVGARSRPLVTQVTGVPAGERPVVHATLVEASVHAFRVGMGVAAGLAVLGGIVSLIGIENPRRRVRCADCPGGALNAAAPVASREPVAASAVTRRDHERLAVHGKSHVAQECLVKNGVNRGLVVDATLWKPFDLRPRGYRKAAHDSD